MVTQIPSPPTSKERVYIDKTFSNVRSANAWIKRMTAEGYQYNDKMSDWCGEDADGHVMIYIGMRLPRPEERSTTS